MSSDAPNQLHLSIDEGTNITNDWYTVIKEALKAVDSKEMEVLLSIIRRRGVFQMKSTQLYIACSMLLEENDKLPSPFHWLLKRLQGAGLPPPYYNYISLEALTIHDYTCKTSAQIAKGTFRVIYDLLSYLLEIHDLEDHPHRQILENRIEAVQEKCREYMFSVDTPDITPAHSIKCSLLPESDVQDELIFLRVLQCTDLIFNASAFLSRTAVEYLAYGNMIETLVTLHWINCLETLLIPLLRPLASIDVVHWLEFRPLIERPSAIQSLNFHHHSTQLDMMQRLFNHPRVPKEQQKYQSSCQELLELSRSLLRRWYKAHCKIAAKYGQVSSTYKPRGVQWLENQYLDQDL